LLFSLLLLLLSVNGRSMAQRRPGSRVAVVTIAIAMALAARVFHSEGDTFAVGHGQHVQVLKHVGAALFGARTWRTRLAASEDAEAASEEEEGEEEEGEDAVSNESQGEKKQYKPRVGLTPALFPELGVADNSDPKKMAGLIAAIFRGDSKLHPGEHRAVDLILKKPDARGKLIYILSYLPKGQNISSQVLPRNRARQARVRVIKNFPVAVPETPDSEVLVAASTDPKKLMRSLEKRLVGAQVANNQTLVQMQMQGDRAASQAMLALESLYFDTWREVTFMPHFLRNETANRTVINIGVTLS